ncbi:VanZ family protein [Nocardiopsis baichengensis]|uniref:VanZ family protein n=1 Tax=Nocardiopsis baichengensis TaxID=280240 RepID=UPI00034C05A6|nr:VanZ family protein [Nocardiopsis baichengensis]
MAAVPAVVFAAAVGAALFFRVHLGRYGRIAGWQGQVTLAVLAAGLAVGLLAVWPLPRGADGLCAIDGGAPALPHPLALGELPGSWRTAALHAGAASGVFALVGALLRYRYRRGLPFTAALAALLALVVEAVQYTGVLGLYPCAYRVAAVDDVLLGAAGGAAGWLIGCAAVRLLPRAWPGAVMDSMPPGLSRRLGGHALDLVLWWNGTLLAVAVLVDTGTITLVRAPEAHRIALVAAAVGGGLLVPLLRTDRGTPGRASMRLAVSSPGESGPAARWRTTLRAALLYTPVVVLFVLGLQPWALLVALVHGAPELVRRDQAGTADLIAGTRITTTAAVTGRMPTKLIRYFPSLRTGPPQQRVGS